MSVNNLFSNELNNKIDDLYQLRIKTDDNNSLSAITEAILFSSNEAVDEKKLAAFLDIELNKMLDILENIAISCIEEHRGIQLQNKNGLWRFITKTELGQQVASFLEVRRHGNLSQAAMEVLAIIAYNQPITKSYITQIRGINSSEIVENLLEKNLLTESGYLNVPGKPMTYKTTDKFLIVFNLKSLSELPDISKFISENESEIDLNFENMTISQNIEG